MIDAYEIGIQLLLQDDVSAGLAVINRGLAEADRAIAATSASLVGLVHDADRAAKAIAIAAGSKVPQAGTAAPISSISPGEAERPAEKRRVPVGAPAAVDGVRERGADVPVSPLKAGPADDRQPMQGSPAPNVVERSSGASAPVRSAAPEVEVPTGQQSVPVAEFTGAPARPAVGTTNAGSDAPRRQGVRDGAGIDTGVRQKPSAPSSLTTVTSTIGNARTASSPAAGSTRVGPRPAERLSVERDRAAAPWSSIGQAAPQPQMARSAERAVAPPSPGRERADGGGGAVMLDGRLVGQWLSEHMAQEASRPPGGTSFFDARQTPAWNVSGAL